MERSYSGMGEWQGRTKWPLDFSLLGLIENIRQQKNKWFCSSTGRKATKVAFVLDSYSLY